MALGPLAQISPINQYTNLTIMVRNNLKIALRTLQKNRGASLINLLGLTVGIAACLLILLFVRHELSYERWNPNSERIVRPYADINFGNSLMQMAVTGSIVGPDCAKDLPEVEAFCRLRNYGAYVVKRQGDDEQNFKEEQVLSADSSFFRLFPTPVIAGDPDKCLAGPHQMAISESAAEKYFGGSEAALGQTLVLDNREEWKVTAVYQDLPENTHFKADLLLSLVGNEEIASDPPFWAMSNNFLTYLLLAEDVGIDEFQTKFAAYSQEKVAITAQQFLGMSLKDFEGTGQYAIIDLQRLEDIHLYSDLDYEAEPNGSIQYVWIFGAIAFFILLIACINYMNLTTARSAQRAKEIGVRKVLGSRRNALIGQFLSESLVMTALSMGVAIVLTYLALPWFRDLTGRQISFLAAFPGVVLVLLAATAAITLLAGAYPAFFLSGFQPLRMLRAATGEGRGKGSLRSALVIFQFIASTVLITGTLLVYYQLRFIQQKKLGFEKEQVVILHDAYGLGNNLLPFKEEMQKAPGVESVAISSYLPVESSRSNTTYSTTPEFRVDNSVNMESWRVDFDYARTMGLELEKGRFFDPAMPSDSFAIVLNATAAKNFGYEADPLGKKVYTIAGDFRAPSGQDDFVGYTVIGVVKDFHFASLRESIGSLGMTIGRSTGSMALRYEAAHSREVLAALENNWRQMAPGQVFSYSFLDDEFARMYESEQRLGKIALIFAFWAIFISCMGLLGLASYVAEQRTKEIGVRKVLGASALDIVGLLSRNFLQLILIAVTIALPLAWYFMRAWLDHFAYRIDLHWWVFALSAGIAICIALLTLGLQSLQAALADPVKSLRRE